MAESPKTPPRDCPLCPRLAEFRKQNRSTCTTYFNAPVHSFGALGSALLIVGLAPGLHGANCTGRPFTGDYAGDLLYKTLANIGLTYGTYAGRADDGFTLRSVRVTNAVRCVPPQNKPLPAETHSCREFLIAEIAAMPKLRTILALGAVAHDSVLRVLGLRKAIHPFKHGVRYDTEKISFFASYHCSRYNTNTRVLTEAMFVRVLKDAKAAAGL